MRGEACENLPRVGDAAKGCRWPVRKSDLRGKRRDPWRWGNALPEAVADLVLKVKTRGKELADVS